MALPSTYTQLEYIESTGTQYIDTAYIPSGTSKAEVKFRMLSHTNNSETWAFSTWKTDNLRWRAGINDQNVFDTSRGFTYSQSTILNVDTVATGEVSGSTDLSVYLFCQNQNGSPLFVQDRIRMYYVQIWQNDVLVRDMIPARRNSDNVAGMYDLANDVFYTNKGSGSFAVPRIVTASVSGTGTVTGDGQFVEGDTATLTASGGTFDKWTLDDYEELDYLQSSGTQYINTEFKPSGTSRAEVKFRMVSHTSGQETWAFALWESASSGIKWRAGISSSNSFDTSRGFTYSQSTITGVDTVATGSISGSATYPVYLFAQDQDGSALHLRDQIRIYYVQIWQNDVLVRDMIPAIRTTDNVVGMWDRVNWKFYENKGSGSFTGGTSQGNIEYTDNPLSFPVYQDINITAVFSGPPPEYTVTTSVSPSGTGTTTGDGTYYGGTSVTVEATANAGYAFVNWTVGGVEVSTSASYTFTLTGDTDLVANFLPTYTISTAVSPGGTGSVTGGGTYVSGSSVVLTAVALPGYSFIEWNDGDVSNPRTITVTGDATYTARFGNTPLPAKYIVCSCLGGTNVYFDTGEVPTNDLCITGLFYSEYAAATYLFGARNTNSESSAGQLAYRKRVDTTTDRIYYGSTYTDVRHKNPQIWVSNVNNEFTSLSAALLNNVTMTESTFTGTQSIYILGCNSGGTYVGGGASYIANFRMERNGVLLHEYLPVYDTSDSTFKLYDMVTQTELLPNGTLDEMSLIKVQGSTGGDAYIEHEVLGRVKQMYTRKLSSVSYNTLPCRYVYGAQIHALPKKGYVFKQWKRGNYDTTYPQHIYAVRTQGVTLTAQFSKKAENQTNKHILLGLEYGMGVLQAETPQTNGRDSDFYTTVNSFKINVDGLERATSTIIVDSVPSTYQVNMGVVLFDPHGNQVYLGIIKAIEGNTLTCREPLSAFDTDIFNNTAYNVNTTSYYALYVSGIYTSLLGYSSPTVWPGVDPVNYSALRMFQLFRRNDVYGQPRYDWRRNSLSSISALATNTTLNLEEKILESFRDFGANIKVFLMRMGAATTTYVGYKAYFQLVPMYVNQEETLAIGTNYEGVSNVDIKVENQYYTSLDVYIDNSGSVVRGGIWSKLKDNGKIVQLTQSNLQDTVAYNDYKKAVVFSSDEISTLTTKYLLNSEYNHQITFDVDLSNDVYRFTDFEVGRWVKFYDGDKVYNSIITGYSFNSNGEEVKSMTVTLGNVRDTLTSKLNQGRI